MKENQKRVHGSVGMEMWFQKLEQALDERPEKQMGAGLHWQQEKGSILKANEAIKGLQTHSFILWA